MDPRPPPSECIPALALSAQGTRGTSDERAELFDNGDGLAARPWKLPEVWTHRTRPHLLGNHKTVSTSFHRLHPHTSIAFARMVQGTPAPLVPCRPPRV